MSYNICVYEYVLCVCCVCVADVFGAVSVWWFV